MSTEPAGRGRSTIALMTTSMTTTTAHAAMSAAHRQPSHGHTMATNAAVHTAPTMGPPRNEMVRGIHQATPLMSALVTQRCTATSPGMSPVLATMAHSITSTSVAPVAMTRALPRCGRIRSAGDGTVGRAAPDAHPLHRLRGTVDAARAVVVMAQRPGDRRTVHA